MNRTQTIKKLDKCWAGQVIGGGPCEVCGSRFMVDAHHYIKRTNFNLRWNIRNGIRLCRLKCHKWAESDPKWFAKWFQKNRPADKEYCDRVAKEPIKPIKTYMLKERI